MTLEKKPPRRDPRVLALVPTTGAIQYATLDAWEIAGTGALKVDDAKGFALSVRRLIVQTRPTAIVCAPPRTRGPKLTRLLKLAATVAAHSGIPLVSLAGDLARDLIDDAPAVDAIAEQYPELRALAVRDGEDAIRLASSALSSLNFPSRTYASSHPSRPGATVAPAATRSPRRARVPLDVPARRRACSANGRGRRGARPPRP